MRRDSRFVYRHAMATMEPINGVVMEQDAQNMAFAQLCAENDLLKRPAGLEDQDLCDGLSDLPTLLYVLTRPASRCCGTDPHRRFLIARRYDQDAALEQFREATQFRSDKDVVRLYDVIEVADFEQTRQFVSFG